MSFIESIILGIVEGITEFIPVSSTAHLMGTSQLLGLDLNNEFVKTFQIAIQLGAILAVLVMYFRRLVSDRALIGKVIVGFIPTAIIGFFLYPFIKDVLLESIKISAWALIIGGILMILIEKYFIKNESVSTSNVSWKQSIALGFFQSLAMIPGVSRSAATIMGGLLMGINRATITEFSFLLAIPTMAGASGLDLISSFGTIQSNQWPVLLVGFVVSAITAGFVIRWFISFIKSNSFSNFGLYRIAVGLLFLFWLV